MGFLKFTLLCIDSLAWPIFALGYPMYASIRAIETGTKDQMRKLVIYWTLFSLFYMFELAFAKIIQGIPFWSWIKLILICWLVVPQFNGACHAYRSIVHPCLYMNLREYMYLLKKPEEERLLKAEMFLDVAEKYIKENGSEALEKLISSKLEEACASSKDTEILKVSEMSASIDAKQVPHVESISVVRDEKGTTEGAEIKEMTQPVTSEGNPRVETETPPMKNVQREWTCALCQVTTTSEKTLNEHLNGSKHKSKCESQKESKNNKKNAQSSPSKTDKSNQGKPNAANSKGGEAKQKPFMKTEASVEQKQARQKKNAAAAAQQHKLFCVICNVKLLSEINLASHVKGKKHLCNIENLKKL